MNEELVYKPEDTRIFLIPVLIFPSGNDLLAVSVGRYSLNLHFYRVNLTSHEAVDLGEVSGNLHDVVWSVPGRTVLFGRMVNGLTNIWAYSLNDRSLTQITFGTGPDYLPMPDPGGKGIYFVNGQSSGALTAYHVQSKESRDIVSEDATAPDISPDGKRLTYTVLTTDKRRELWVADIDGENRLRIATGEHIGGTTWAPDNSHLAFSEHSAGTGAGDKIYIIGADGSGLRQVPRNSKNYLEHRMEP